MILPTELPGLLGPGVYLLHYRGRVAYIGRTACLLKSIAAHRETIGNHVSFTKRIYFDEVSIVSCSVADSRAVADELILLHSPPHNTSRHATLSMPCNLPPSPTYNLPRRL